MIHQLEIKMYVFGCIMVRTSYIQWDVDEVRFVLDHHPYFYFYCVSSLQQQSTGRHVPPLSSPREDMSLHSAVHGKTCPSTQQSTGIHVPPLSSSREDMFLHSAVHGKTCPSTQQFTGRHVPPLEHTN
jgi:hypothetical protein